MNNSVNFLIGSFILVLSATLTFFLTRKLYTRQCSNSLPHISQQKQNKIVVNNTSTTSPTICASQQISIAENLWSLEVNGAVKFDIKVEWSDGSTSFYSGIAPQVYGSNKQIGVIPVNTSGVAPDWADDGISYQWSLNGYHWC